MRIKRKPEVGTDPCHQANYGKSQTGAIEYIDTSLCTCSGDRAKETEPGERGKSFPFFL